MNTYRRHRFPPDIISYAAWLYYRFNLSHRDSEGLLAELGITVSLANSNFMLQLAIETVRDSVSSTGSCTYQQRYRYLTR
jgi:transposase-like protein